MPPGFTWGGRVSSNRIAAEHPLPGFPQRQQDPGRLHQPDESRRPAYPQDRLLQHPHLQGAAARRLEGTITFSNDGNNPLDSTFGFSNAALGIFSSYNQASKYIEGIFIYNNTEGYIQDNWKVNSRLTLDYGVRLVHQQPQYHKLGQASNFLPDDWSLAAAPALYVAMCPNNASSCARAPVRPGIR